MIPGTCEGRKFGWSSNIASSELRVRFTHLLRATTGWLQETVLAVDRILVQGLLLFCRLRTMQSKLRANAKTLHQALRQDRQQHLYYIAEQAGSMSHRDFHFAMKQIGISGRNSKRGLRPLPILAGEQGHILTSTEEVAERWRSFFAEQEDGCSIDLHDLHQRHDDLNGHLRSLPQWHEVPSLLELERQFA